MPEVPMQERSSGRHALVSHSIYIFLIRFFPALASLLANILLARTLPEEIYGRYQNFWIQWSVLNAIACMGLPPFLLTYSSADLHRFLGSAGKNGGFLLIGCILIAGVVFSGLQWHSGLFPFWLPAVYLPVHAFIAILESYLMLGRRFRYLTVINIGYAVFFGAAHWLLIRHHLSFQQLFLLLLAGSGCRLALITLPSAAMFRVSRPAPGAAAALRPMGRLWLHLGIYEVSQMVFRWLDKFVVSLLLAPALSALYAIGTIDVPFLPLLLGAVGGGLLLHMGGRQESDAERIRMMHYSSARLAGIVFPLFFFLGVFRKELFEVVFSGKYNEAAPLFLISLLVVPLRAYNFTAILQHKGAGALINKGALMDVLIAVILMYPLFRLLGLGGIALSFVISTWCQASYYLYHTARLTGVTMQALVPWRSWVKGLIIFSTGFISLHYILSSCFNPSITLILGGSIMVVVMMATVIPLLRSKRNQHGQATTPEGI